MTEIIPHLHQVGAGELQELANADLVIDMGGIINRVYAGYLVDDNIDELKDALSVPIISFEIDEVDGIPFYRYEEKIHHVSRICLVGASWIRKGRNVYTLCLAGQNRSGLASAIIMMYLGHTAKDAVDIIQERRDNALNNIPLRKFILAADEV